MRPPKPRVSVLAEATEATLTWEAVAGAQYYTVSIGDETRQVVDGKITLLDLEPAAAHVAQVQAVAITGSSHPTNVHFTTASLLVSADLGPGSELYPPTLVSITSTTPTSPRPDGYRYDHSRQGTVVGGLVYQFLTFSLGQVEQRTSATFKLHGTSGDWEGGNHILLVRVLPGTGWLNARLHCVPGIRDLLDGARAKQAQLGTSHTVTFNGSVVSGRFLLRVGIEEQSNQALSGAELMP